MENRSQTDEHAGEAALDDLLCPVCDYALRGLPEPRCPECGYAFEWAELLEQTRLRQGWFYEHAGTVKSHLRTRWRSLRPSKFWGEIHAYTLANARRLWWYRGTTFVLALVVAAVLFGLPATVNLLDRYLPQGRVVNATTLPTSGRYSLAYSRPYRVLSPATQAYVWIKVPAQIPTTQGIPARPATRRRISYPPVGPFQTQYTYFVPPPVWAEWLRGGMQFRGRAIDTHIARATLGVPLLLVFGLPLYWRLLRGSVLRAEIRPVHLARVDAYSTDALPWLLIVLAVVEVGWSLAFNYYQTARSFELSVLHASIGPLVVVGGLTLRLSSALRRYVRFPHALGVACGFGVIAGLAWIIVVLQFTAG